MGKRRSASEFNFFTGKPEIENLGYTFLFRNYQANTGKWQTSDPIALTQLQKSEKNTDTNISIGYPDGWNNLAYVNNNVTSYIDWQGLAGKWVLSNDTGVPYPANYYTPTQSAGGMEYRNHVIYEFRNQIIGAEVSETSEDGKTRTVTTTYTWEQRSVWQKQTVDSETYNWINSGVPTISEWTSGTGDRVVTYVWKGNRKCLKLLYFLE